MPLAYAVSESPNLPFAPSAVEGQSVGSITRSKVEGLAIP